MYHNHQQQRPSSSSGNYRRQGGGGSTTTHAKNSSSRANDGSSGYPSHGEQHRRAPSGRETGSFLGSSRDTGINQTTPRGAPTPAGTTPLATMKRGPFQRQNDSLWSDCQQKAAKAERLVHEMVDIKRHIQTARVRTCITSGITFLCIQHHTP